MAVAYGPSEQHEIKVWDVEYRRDPIRTLQARIYQPQGQGLFPVLLDVHGGAWNDQDRTANASVDEPILQALTSPCVNSCSMAQKPICSHASRQASRS